MPIQVPSSICQGRMWVAPATMFTTAKGAMGVSRIRITASRPRRPRASLSRRTRGPARRLSSSWPSTWPMRWLISAASPALAKHSAMPQTGPKAAITSRLSSTRGRARHSAALIISQTARGPSAAACARSHRRASPPRSQACQWSCCQAQASSSRPASRKTSRARRHRRAGASAARLMARSWCPSAPAGCRPGAAHARVRTWNRAGRAPRCCAGAGRRAAASPGTAGGSSAAGPWS